MAFKWLGATGFLSKSLLITFFLVALSVVLTRAPFQAIPKFLLSLSAESNCSIATVHASLDVIVEDLLDLVFPVCDSVQHPYLSSSRTSSMAQHNQPMCFLDVFDEQPQKHWNFSEIVRQAVVHPRTPQREKQVFQRPTSITKMIRACDALYDTVLPSKSSTGADAEIHNPYWFRHGGVGFYASPTARDRTESEGKHQGSSSRSRTVLSGERPTLRLTTAHLMRPPGVVPDAVLIERGLICVRDGNTIYSSSLLRSSVKRNFTMTEETDDHLSSAIPVVRSHPFALLPLTHNVLFGRQGNDTDDRVRFHRAFGIVMTDPLAPWNFFHFLKLNFVGVLWFLLSYRNGELLAPASVVHNISMGEFVPRKRKTDYADLNRNLLRLTGGALRSNATIDVVNSLMATQESMHEVPLHVLVASRGRHIVRCRECVTLLRMVGSYINMVKEKSRLGRVSQRLLADMTAWIRSEASTLEFLQKAIRGTQDCSSSIYGATANFPSAEHFLIAFNRTLQLKVDRLVDRLRRELNILVNLDDHGIPDWEGDHSFLIETPTKATQRMPEMDKEDRENNTTTLNQHLLKSMLNVPTTKSKQTLKKARSPIPQNPRLMHCYCGAALVLEQGAFPPVEPIVPSVEEEERPPIRVPENGGRDLNAISELNQGGIALAFFRESVTEVYGLSPQGRARDVLDLPLESPDVSTQGLVHAEALNEYNTTLQRMPKEASNFRLMAFPPSMEQWYGWRRVDLNNQTFEPTLNSFAYKMWVGLVNETLQFVQDARGKLFLRESLLASPVSAPRLLFIQRGSNRWIGDVDRIAGVADELGFNVAYSVFDKISVRTRASMIRYADVFLGMHGFALSWVFLMRSRTPMYSLKNPVLRNIFQFYFKHHAHEFESRCGVLKRYSNDTLRCLHENQFVRNNNPLFRGDSTVMDAGGCGTHRISTLLEFWPYAHNFFCYEELSEWNGMNHQKVFPFDATFFSKVSPAIEKKRLLKAAFIYNLKSFWYQIALYDSQYVRTNLIDALEQYLRSILSERVQVLQRFAANFGTSCE